MLLHPPPEKRERKPRQSQYKVLKELEASHLHLGSSKAKSSGHSGDGKGKGKSVPVRQRQRKAFVRATASGGTVQAPAYGRMGGCRDAFDQLANHVRYFDFLLVH